jgi:hypothetical protein
MKDLSDAELLAEYAKRKLERNGVCTNGYDFMKGITLGFLVGRFRMGPVLLGMAAGVWADSTFQLPEVEPLVKPVIDPIAEKVKEIFNSS